MSLGCGGAAAYTHRVLQRFSSVYTSDVAMAMSIMVALQLIGLLAVVQLIHSVA